MKDRKIMSKCCICKKIKRKKCLKYSDRSHLDEWGHHPEDLAHLHKHYDIVFSHGYCDDCARIVLAEIDNLPINQPI